MPIRRFFLPEWKTKLNELGASGQSHGVKLRRTSDCVTFPARPIVTRIHNAPIRRVDIGDKSVISLCRRDFARIWVWELLPMRRTDAAWIAAPHFRREQNARNDWTCRVRADRVSMTPRHRRCSGRPREWSIATESRTGWTAAKTSGPESRSVSDRSGMIDSDRRENVETGWIDVPRSSAVTPRAPGRVSCPGAALVP